MPKENISRSIDRGLGKGETISLEKAVYEGFGPGGAAIMVETVSDNNTRTASALRAIFAKHGGNLATPGSVSYLFERVGEIEVDNGDAIFEKAVEAGAIDVEDDIVYTKPEDLHRISEALGKTGSLAFRPNKGTIVEVSDTAKLYELLDAIEELDDVQNVYTNTR